MAVNLTAIFKVRDQGTAKLRQLTQTMEKMNRASKTTSDSMSKAQSATNRLGGAVSSTSNRMGGFSAKISRLHVNSNGLSASFGGLQSTLVGLASAYLTAQGAAKAFDATIGAAARYQQSEVAVKAIFNDDDASRAYLQMVDKMAIDSPLLNSTEMLASSKGLVAMTKNIEDLGASWSIIEKLMVLDPTQGTDGAAFALKEMFQGDSLSMVERFGLNKSELNRIKKLGIPQQVAEINKLLDGMGITQKTVEAMGSTTLGYWSQIGERVEKFMRQIGNLGNSKLGDTLGKIVEAFDNADIDGLAAKIDEKIAGLVDNAIEFGKTLWKWREPIAYVAGALATFVGALAIVGTISALANPISLIAAGISALVLGFKALYENSESFRNVIDGIKSKASELIGAFKADGVKGVLDAILPEGAVGKITDIVTSIKNVVGTVVTWLKTKFDDIKPSLQTLATKFLSLKDTVINALSTLLTISEPILSGLWSALQIVGDVASMVFNNIVAPAIEYAIQVIQTLWSVAEPILTLLAGAFEFAFGALKVIWDNVLKPFVEWILGAFKGALELLGDAMKVLGDNFGLFRDVFSNVWDAVVKTAETAVNAVINMINALIDTINNIPLIEIDAVANVNWSGDALGAVGTVNTNVTRGMTPGHYHGLDNVPYDGYVARLHRGERVQTAQEVREEKASGGIGGGITVSGNTFHVRQESDIEKVAYELAKLIERERLQRG